MTLIHPAAPAGTDQLALLAAIANGELYTDASDSIWWGDRPLTLPEVLWLLDDHDYAAAPTAQPVRLSKSGREALAVRQAALR